MGALLLQDQVVQPGRVLQGVGDFAGGPIRVGFGKAISGGLQGFVFLIRFFEKPAVFADEQIQVGLGVMGKGFRQVLCLDGLDKRQVNVVVPGRNGFCVRDRFAVLFTNEPVMGADMFEEALIFAGQGQFQVGSGTIGDDPRLFEEFGVGAFLFQFVGLNIRGQVDGDVNFDDKGIYIGLTVFAGDGNAVIAVFDEVHFPDFVEFDRRQVDVFVLRSVNADPAPGGAGVFGGESAVEVVVSPDAANDIRDGDALQADIALPFEGEDLSHLIVGKEFVIFSRQPGVDLAPESPSHGTLEVVFCECFVHRVSMIPAVLVL